MKVTQINISNYSDISQIVKTVAKLANPICQMFSFIQFPIKLKTNWTVHYIHATTALSTAFKTNNTVY